MKKHHKIILYYHLAYLVIIRAYVFLSVTLKYAFIRWFGGDVQSFNLAIALIICLLIVLYYKLVQKPERPKAKAEIFLLSGLMLILFGLILLVNHSLGQLFLDDPKMATQETRLDSFYDLFKASLNIGILLVLFYCTFIQKKSSTPREDEER